MLNILLLGFDKFLYLENEHDSQIIFDIIYN